ncbi:MAG: translation initiation factor IF-2 [Bacteroidetes bacterium]|nr:translation initiation factor IF-2 [Bacteroidota bacterium]
MKVFQAAREFNVSTDAIIEFLKKKGYKDVSTIASNLSDAEYGECLAHFQKDKAAAERINQKIQQINASKQKDHPAPAPVHAPAPVVKTPEPVHVPEPVAIPEPVVEIQKPEPVVEPVPAVPEAPVVIAEATPEPVVVPPVKKGLTVIGKIDLSLTSGRSSKPAEKKKEPVPEQPAAVEPEPKQEQKPEQVSEPVPAEPKIIQPAETVSAEVESVEAHPVGETSGEEPEAIAEDDGEKQFKSHTAFHRTELKVTVKGKIDLAGIKQQEFVKRPRKKGRKDDGPSTPAQGGQGQGQGQQRDLTALRHGSASRPARVPGEPVKPAAGAPKPKPGVTATTSTSTAPKPGDKKKELPGAKKEGEETGPKGLGKKRKIKKGKVVELTAEEVLQSIRTTLATMDDSTFTGRHAAKKRKKHQREMAEAEKQQEIIRQSTIIKVTDFASANELAGLMNVPVNQVLAKCLGMGLFVSINQRLERDNIELIASDFGFGVEFQDEFAEDIYTNNDDEDPEDLVNRAPVVTIMGHVDHGKTSLLDYIRKASVVAGEAGGITQHIGAYSVKLPDDRMMTFLDTPGHEAFTAMRARGAKVTDIVIIVIAADDSVMPQTLEAINHAQAGGVPMVFAINKIDKNNSNIERIYQQLSEKNILVEEWGGKYQVAKVSAKTGIGIPELLEKVLLESEILDLKANPDRNAQGAVIEAEIDKGKGTIVTVLVQTGTLKVGDIFLCGATYGRVRALLDERGKKMKQAGPSMPAQILGFADVPQAGDIMVVMDSEKEARDIAQKRQILKREQEQRRAQKHMSLDMISQRMSEGSIRDLNIIVKGDVDGSVEALSDSLMRLSTGEVRVRVIHKAVGPISESDVLLASASDAIIIGFQVRPNLNAKKLAATEEIDIRLYSIIYDAINEVKLALEGMLSPEITEEVTSTLEIRDTFKISKIGTIAGCMVLEGKIHRNSKIRVVRDGIVVFTGELDSLKRFKDDAKEVEKGFECGLNVKNFNDIKVGDLIESFKMVETKRTLA